MLMIGNSFELENSVSMLARSLLIKVAGDQDRHKSSGNFDFGHLISMANLLS